MEHRAYEIRLLPDGAVRFTRIENGVLIIYLPDNLDEVTRQRYVDEAIKERHWYRDRTLPIPLLAPIAGVGKRARDAIQEHTAASAIATVVTLSGVAGLTAYAINGGAGRQHTPPAAAPAAPHPRPTFRQHPAQHPRTAPHPRPTTSPPASTVPVAVAAMTIGLGAASPISRTVPAVRVPRLVRRAPSLPAPPVKPPPVPPPVPSPAPRPAVGCLARLNVAGLADLRVGCGMQ